jgi:hypothetical protein
VNSPFHKTDRSPEQVWKDFVVAIAKLQQLQAVNQNIRTYRAKRMALASSVQIVKEQK